MNINSSAYNNVLPKNDGAYPTHVDLEKLPTQYPNVSSSSGATFNNSVNKYAALKIVGGFAGSFLCLIIFGKTAGLGALPTYHLNMDKFANMLPNKFSRHRTDNYDYENANAFNNQTWEERRINDSIAVEQKLDSMMNEAMSTSIPDEPIASATSTTTTTTETNTTTATATPTPVATTPSPNPAPVATATVTPDAPPPVVYPTSLDGFLKVIGSSKEDFDTRFTYSEVCLMNYFTKNAEAIEYDTNGAELRRMPVSEMLGIMRMNEVGVKVKNKTAAKGGRINSIGVTFLY